TSIENITGSASGDDMISGNAGVNVLNGNGGSDSLFGEGGDDTLITDGLDVVLDGGEGVDTIDLSGISEGVTVDLDTNTPMPGPATETGQLTVGSNTTVLTDIENVIGTAFNDTLFGNNELNDIDAGAGDDIVHTFAGADTVDGGDGTDTILFSAGGAVTIDLDDNGDATAVIGGADADTIMNFENVNGSTTGGDTISGNAGVNVLNGQGGDDTLDGEGGNDTLIGGTGNDTLIGGEGEDTATYADLSADITVTDNGDGSLTVTTLTEGVDTLTGVETILDGNGDVVFTSLTASATSLSVSSATASLAIPGDGSAAVFDDGLDSAAFAASLAAADTVEIA
ncbi:MAG: calcium-binding protein, partial [Pseudomonadota bacterium]